MTDAAARGPPQALDGCAVRQRSLIYQLFTGLLCLLPPLLSGGCADVLFERSPYALRALDIVYSDQEDMTFMVWRLRDSADPSLVRFELWQDGDYRPIALEDAPFPAEAYPCDQYYLCFQYQLPGRVTWEEGVLPVRSIHEEEGIYGGIKPRLRRASQTFQYAPIAVDRNESIDMQRYDWFEREGIPLKRGYEYQLVLSSDDYGVGDAGLVCASPVEGSWGQFDDEIKLDYAWVEAPRCMVARPARRDGEGGVEVVLLMPPSAELVNELQEYRPPELTPPIIYVYLIDLLIRSEERCERAQREIMRTIDGQIASRAPGAIRLGPFYPQDSISGEIKDGCKQASAQDYPVQQILDVVEREAAKLLPQTVRVVIVYMNNADLPPSPRVLDQLTELGARLSRVRDVMPYTLAIVSNALISDENKWGWHIGWRPIDDTTFTDDMVSWGRAELPFRTTDHDNSNTPILIPTPQGARREPQAFKICASSPPFQGIQLGAEGRRVAPGFAFYRWPQDDVPRYFVDLPVQVLVPHKKYKKALASIVVEACERFCDMPFRAAGGEVFTSWSMIDRCQWEDSL